MSAREATIAAIREADKFCLITHENPDGDALGSLIGMHRVLTAMGKDSIPIMHREEFPLAPEYRYFADAGIETEIPADIAERVVIFLDCGNVDRSPLLAAKESAKQVLNIDHHHDNTRFGDIDLVEGTASSTGEMVWSLMGELGVALDRDIASPLYIALVTDTGKFMYENTGVSAHRMAAELIEAGVDVQDMYRRLYEELPVARLLLLQQALNALERFDDGVLTLTHLTREDFARANASESDSEGIVDHLRSVEGTKVAALIRAVDNGRTSKKVSLRSTDGSVDVSQIARELGGGGHRQAAGLSTDLEHEALVAFLREQIAAQL